MRGVFSLRAAFAVQDILCPVNVWIALVLSPVSLRRIRIEDSSRDFEKKKIPVV